MPRFSFHCPYCGKNTGALVKIDEAFVCAHCRNEEVHAAHIIPDDLGKDLVCSTLKGVDGDVRKSPVVRSRSELKRVIEKHNRIYGTDLEQIGKGDMRPQQWAEA